MQDQPQDADRLVFRAISRANAGPAAAAVADAQEVPDLGQVGAAVARSARLAAARHRAFMPRLALARSQASGLLEPDEMEREALLLPLRNEKRGVFERALDRALGASRDENLDADEGRLIPAASPGGAGGGRGGFVWRLHPAPVEAGPALAQPSRPAASPAPLQAGPSREASR